ncbi:MAG TPA: PAS domain S-box protein [Steroidobacteraceae bacterium]|nr:PAS domain S-box protein [Steroidobacteraceae bacterium]
MSTILIAYERELEQMALEKLLIERGHTVVRSSNGVDALEAARREPPQLMISDILLPKMDGFSLCKKWKQDERLQLVPFVFYTRRHDDPKYERFARELGVDRYVERSTDSTVLLKGVDELLAQGASASRPDPQQLQAMATGAFITTGRFNSTQTVVALPTASLPQPTEAGVSPGNGGEDRSVAREAKLMARVTELDALNKQLQASEQRFRQLFDASPTPLWLMSVEDRHCLAVNQAALSLYGFAREEFLNLPRNAPPFAAGAAIAGTMATWHRNKTGAALAIELHVRPVELGARRGEVFAAYDVTQRVFSQQATAHAADAYQAMLVAAADGILLLDEQHHLIDVNQAYCRLSGYDREEMLKLAPAQLEAKIDDETSTRLQQWRAAEQAGDNSADRSRYHTKHVRKDGTQYPVEVSIGSVTGARSRTVIVVRDRSIRDAQEKILETQLHAEQKLQATRINALNNALQLHRIALSHDEPAIVKRALELAVQITSSPVAYACATDVSQTTATLSATFDRTRGVVAIEPAASALSSKGPSAQCMRTAQPTIINDKKNSEAHDALPEQSTALILPIMDGDKTLGALAVANREQSYTGDDRLLLAPLAESLGAILASKRSQAHTAMLAHTAELALKGLMANLAPDKK